GGRRPPAWGAYGPRRRAVPPCRLAVGPPRRSVPARWRSRRRRSRIPRTKGGVRTDAKRPARAYLLRVAEPPAPALHRFVAEHGPIEAARRVREAAVPEAAAAETAARRGLDRAERDLDS